jgi:hypothetical protein
MTDTKPAEPTDKTAPQTPRPRFLEPNEPRRAPLGRLRTDEEARLAAEIEKLRG